MSRIKDTKVYYINDFWEWFDKGELILSPKYQRKSVWNSKAESYLIDTIIRGLPIPQVFLRHSIDPYLKKTTREVIDGQQRLRTIIKFIKNEFPIMKQHNSEYGGKFYNDLDYEMQKSFLEYQIPVELIMTDDENLVYDMFVRVNTNSYVLNRQELRNAKYWGDFKVLVYNLSSKYRTFFKEFNIFKDSEIIRMKDSEFISSLLILTNDGIKSDTPKTLDDYYNKYDNLLPAHLNLESKFSFVFEKIIEIYEDHLFVTKYFNKTNYFYTLFAYMLYITGNNSLEFDEVNEDRFDLVNIKNKLENLESKLNREEDEMDIQIRRFRDLHKTRTTNEIERKERISFFIDFMGISLYGN